MLGAEEMEQFLRARGKRAFQKGLLFVSTCGGEHLKAADFCYSKPESKE